MVTACRTSFIQHCDSNQLMVIKRNELVGVEPLASSLGHISYPLCQCFTPLSSKKLFQGQLARLDRLSNIVILPIIGLDR